MDIYLDMVIIENIIVNLFLVTLTYKILRINYSFKYAIVSSSVGALYSITLLFESLNFLSSLPFQIGVAIFICFVPLRMKSVKVMIKTTVTFVGISFILSGICFKFMINSREYMLLDGVLISNFKVKYLILSIFLIYLILDRIITIIKDKNVLTNFIYDTRINIKGSEIEIKSFLDTGNELREPVTNLPCILVEDNCLRYDKKIIDGAYSIPYKAIGYEGCLKGIKADFVKIKQGKEEWKEIQAIVCICSDKLSKENEFNALLSRGIL